MDQVIVSGYLVGTLILLLGGLKSRDRLRTVLSVAFLWPLYLPLCFVVAVLERLATRK